MQRYESYKPSGAEWLGDIPAHWTVTPAKRLFREVSEKNHPDAELLSVTQEFGVVPRDQLEQRVVMPTGQLQTFKLVRADDFVISLRSFQGGIEYSEFTGLVSPAYTILRKQKNANSRYLKHLLKSAPFISELNTSVTGIREGKNISFSEMAYSLLPLPAASEQARIADFLEVKTAEIDAAIAKKERLIELLQEQKKAAIRRAVTLGINENHRLLPHDLSYLKQVPSNWSIKRNKQLFFEKKGVVGKQAPSYTLLSLTLNGVIPRDLDNPKGKFPAEFDTYKKVQPNDMVFCLFDVEETPRTVGRARHVGMITGAYTVVECFDPSLAGYLSYFYTALDDEKMLRPFYTGLRNVIQRNTFFGLQVPIPPENERQEIVEYIDSVIHHTAQLAEKAKQEVISLQEFKNTLVASAVTGRIKV